MLIWLNKKVYGAEGSLIKVHKGKIPVVILLRLWKPLVCRKQLHEMEKTACKTHLAFSHEAYRSNTGCIKNLNIVPGAFNYLSRIISSAGKFLIEEHIWELVLSVGTGMNEGMSETAVICSEASCTQWDVHLICSNTFCYC